MIQPDKTGETAMLQAEVKELSEKGFMVGIGSHTGVGGYRTHYAYAIPQLEYSEMLNEMNARRHGEWLEEARQSYLLRRPVQEYIRVDELSEADLLGNPRYRLGKSSLVAFRRARKKAEAMEEASDIENSKRLSALDQLFD